MIRSRSLAIAVSLLGFSGVHPCSAQIAKGASKFLGNLYTSGDSLSTFDTYWNQLTPETAGKWPAVEGLRDQMKWDNLEAAATYAKGHGIPWTFSALIWPGTSYPSWFSSLAPDTLKAQIQEWFDSAGTRYPEVSTVVVVYEPLPNHGSSSMIVHALGGSSSTDSTWIIEAFRMARRAFPRAKLLISDYNTIEYASDHAGMLKIVKSLQAVGAPIDGIGCEAHDAYKKPVDTLKKYLDSFATTGLPIYITEYDIAASNDTVQDSIMRVQFPLFWNHPAVAGITYYGYAVGSTWRTGTGLINKDGTERPALKWLKEYVAAHPNPPSPIHGSVGLSGPANRPRGTLRAGLVVREIRGRLVTGLERNGQFLAIGLLGRD
jgi:endo-1,4-beta-xylanase